MQGLPVLTLLLHVIVLAQCQYCSCIYILLPRNSVFPLNSSRPTFSILAAASIQVYLRKIIFKSLLKICPILSIQTLDSRPYFNISQIRSSYHHFSYRKTVLIRKLTVYELQVSNQGLSDRNIYTTFQKDTSRPFLLLYLSSIRMLVTIYAISNYFLP